MFGFDFGEFAGDEGEGFIPGSFAEAVAFPNQRLGEPVGTVDVLPAKLALDAGGDAVGRAVGGFDLEDVALGFGLLGPDVKAAADTAVRTDGLGLLNTLFAHRGFDFRQLQDGSVADLGLDAFDHVDHVVERRLGQAGEVAGMLQHGLFHERVARADGDPKDARVVEFPADR